MRRIRLAATDLFRDVRHALRLLARAPAFTLLAVLTLGLGIGANTAIFTVVNALVLRPLPYPSPERLTFIDGTFHRPDGDTDFQLSYPEFTDLTAEARTFAAIAPWTTGPWSSRCGRTCRRSLSRTGRCATLARRLSPGRTVRFADPRSPSTMTLSPFRPRLRGSA